MEFYVDLIIYIFALIGIIITNLAMFESCINYEKNCTKYKFLLVKNGKRRYYKKES